LTKHLAAKLAHKFINVNAIAAGPFQSKMMAETLKRRGDEMMKQLPLKRIGKVEDIAALCIYLSAKSGDWITGTISFCDGGQSLSIPRY